MKPYSIIIPRNILVFHCLYTYHRFMAHINTIMLSVPWKIQYNLTIVLKYYLNIREYIPVLFLYSVYRLNTKFLSSIKIWSSVSINAFRNIYMYIIVNMIRIINFICISIIFYLQSPIVDTFIVSITIHYY